jgi:hypothetical protein
VRVVHGVVDVRHGHAHILDRLRAVVPVIDVVNTSCRATKLCDYRPGVVPEYRRRPGVRPRLEGVGRRGRRDDYFGAEGKEDGGGIPDVGVVGLHNLGLVATMQKSVRENLITPPFSTPSTNWSRGQKLTIFNLLVGHRTCFVAHTRTINPILGIGGRDAPCCNCQQTHALNCLPARVGKLNGFVYHRCGQTE